jgi:imidazolonepropionase-like amidohydrolase
MLQMRYLACVCVLTVAIWWLPGSRDVDRVSAQVRPAGGPLALVGGSLIDGASPRPLRDAVVLIRDGRIERVGSVGQLEVPAGYQRIDTDGQTVLPGLWDMHVHLLYAGHTNLQAWHRTYTDRYEQEIMPATARQMLMAGVTTVRDMGAPPEAIFTVARRVASGELQGPTILAAGPQLTVNPPDWARFYRWGTSGAADATAKARQLIESGAALLKVTDAEAMRLDEIRAITDEAHARGRLVSAHGRTDAEIQIGLDGGVDDFQHIGVTPNEFSTLLIGRIAARAREARPLYWTPTVGLPLAMPFLAEDTESLEDPRNLAGLPPLIAADVRQALQAFRPQAPRRDVILRKVAQLREAGVRLLMGTDAGLAGAPHAQATSQEMEAWVDALGFSPMETIQTATAGAARAMGLERTVGSILPGMVADVIVVPGDPLREMAVLRDPAVVLKGGVRVK